MKRINSISTLELICEKIDSANKKQNETAPKDKEWFFGITWRDESTHKLIKRLNQCFKEFDIPEKIEITAEVASYLAHDEKKHNERTRKITDEELKNYGGLYKEYFLAWITGPNVIGIRQKISNINKLQKEYNRLLGYRDKISRQILSNYQLKKENGNYFLIFSWHYVFEFSHGFSASRKPSGVHKSVELDKLPKLPPIQ